MIYVAALIKLSILREITGPTAWSGHTWDANLGSSLRWEALCHLEICSEQRENGDRIQTMDQS